MNKIPFGWLPASWGLKGKSRELAEAEYYLSGYELDIAKARICLLYTSDAADE